MWNGDAWRWHLHRHTTPIVRSIQVLDGDAGAPAAAAALRKPFGFAPRLPRGWYRHAGEYVLAAAREGWRIRSWRLTAEQLDELERFTGQREVLFGYPVVPR